MQPPEALSAVSEPDFVLDLTRADAFELFDFASPDRRCRLSEEQWDLQLEVPVLRLFSCDAVLGVSQRQESTILMSIDDMR